MRHRLYSFEYLFRTWWLQLHLVYFRRFFLICRGAVHCFGRLDGFNFFRAFSFPSLTNRTKMLSLAPRTRSFSRSKFTFFNAIFLPSSTNCWKMFRLFCGLGRKTRRSTFNNEKWKNRSFHMRNCNCHVRIRWAMEAYFESNLRSLAQRSRLRISSQLVSMVSFRKIDASFPFSGIFPSPLRGNFRNWHLPSNHDRWKNFLNAYACKPCCPLFLNIKNIFLWIIFKMDCFHLFL